MRKLAITASLIAAVVMAGCGKSSKAPRLTDKALGRLVLQERDVPGLERFSFGREVTSEFNPILGRDPHAFGRQDGWVARYRRRSNSGRGPLTVASVVEVFSNDKGAREFIEAVRTNERETAEPNGLEQVSLEHLGDDVVAVATASASPGSVRFVRISWRDGRFVCTVAASGFARRMSVDDAVALARNQEQRLPS